MGNFYNDGVKREKNRVGDFLAEKLTSRFLNTNLLPKLCVQEGIPIDDVAMQRMGIDVKILTLSGDWKTIDYKSANAQYINTPLLNEAFELSFIGHLRDEYGEYSIPEERQGWFVNPDLLTDIYIIWWLELYERGGKFKKNPIVKRNKYYLSFKYEDIKQVEVIALQKSVLWNYLSQYGIEPDFLHQYAKEFRERCGGTGEVVWDIDEFGRKKWRYINGVVGMALSDGYDERPVNLVINHKKLSELGFFRAMVYANGTIEKLPCGKRDKRNFPFLKSDIKEQK